MSRRHDEVDGTGDEGRIASAHQLFSSLAFSFAADDLLATICEANARTTRAALIIVNHRENPQITRLRSSTQTESLLCARRDDLMSDMKARCSGVEYFVQLGSLMFIAL